MTPAASTSEPLLRPTPPDKRASPSVKWDAVVIGAGFGGLAAATQMAVKGAKVAVLERYLIPGGSGGAFTREGFTFDVGASMMFGLGPAGDPGSTNLITRALAAVGQSAATVPDPTQIHYHLPPSPAHPDGLEVKVWREYGAFIDELTRAFPHERDGIKKFYGECWRVFDALNALELKSLEEPAYLLGQFGRKPGACLTLASFVATNAGDVARKHIQDPELLKFIDMECYCWSTVSADLTPMINAGMVFCDRHYGGINYPVGGTGVLADKLADGLVSHGGVIEYGTRVTGVVVDGAGRASGVTTADGRTLEARAVISNATRWDTFDKLVPASSTPPEEAAFRSKYTKAPSFFSMHLGIKKDVLPEGTECHHIICEDWARMEDARGTLFVSIPSLLDPSLCPPGTHVFHAFTPDWVDAWPAKDADPAGYAAAKEAAADAFVDRLEAFFPGLKAGTIFREVGTPRTHRRFLGRVDGTYGPIPAKRLAGMLAMPMARTGLPGLYCAGDSTFPGQGVNAVVFSGVGCAHRVLADQGRVPTIPGVDGAFNALLRAARAWA